MIFLITGKPGSFKTLSTIERVQKYQQDQAKQGLVREVYTNINGIDVEGWKTLEDPKEWYTLPEGAIIVVDECQKETAGFGAMSATARQPLTITELETHRHHGFDLFLITQGVHLINSRIRPLVDEHYHYLRKYGWDRAHVYISTGIIPTTEKESVLRKEYEHQLYRPNKKTYKLYHSSSLHTVRKRAPRAVVLGVPALLLIAYCIYEGVTSVAGMGGGAVEKKQILAIMPAGLTLLLSVMVAWCQLRALRIAMRLNSILLSTMRPASKPCRKRHRPMMTCASRKTSPGHNA